MDEIEAFLTGCRPTPLPNRALLTVLFTDIVGSTEAAELFGDRRWRDLLEVYDRTVRQSVSRWGGRLIDMSGDGAFATFDGPARAIHCAETIRDEMAESGVRLRAGVHTGECEVGESGVRGIAVHIGARISSLAGPAEILVSSTVKDLVAGSGITFSSQGRHTLKGVAETWQIYLAEV